MHEKGKNGGFPTEKSFSFKKSKIISTLEFLAYPRFE